MHAQEEAQKMHPPRSTQHRVTSSQRISLRGRGGGDGGGGGAGGGKTGGAKREARRLMGSGGSGGADRGGGVSGCGCGGWGGVEAELEDEGVEEQPGWGSLIDRGEGDGETPGGSDGEGGEGSEESEEVDEHGNLKGFVASGSEDEEEYNEEQKQVLKRGMVSGVGAAFFL